MTTSITPWSITISSTGITGVLTQTKEYNLNMRDMFACLKNKE